jgi:ABC-type transport system substrate-binding protein
MQAQLEMVGIKTEIQSFENALWQDVKVSGVGEWDICVDGLGGSMIQNAWKVKWLPDNFSTGMTQSAATDPRIQELLSAVNNVDTYGPETVEAFHDFMVEQAYGYGLFSPATQCVSVDSITDIKYTLKGYVAPAACTYTDSYSYTV